jgi:hypothetical protein
MVGANPQEPPPNRQVFRAIPLASCREIYEAKTRLCDSPRGCDAPARRT